MLGAEKVPLSKICRTYPTMKKLGTITLPKGDPKNIGTKSNPLSFTDVSILSLEISKFAILRYVDIDYILVHNV